MNFLPQYTLGVDVSKYQGKMDWAKASNAGAKFAIIRAGYGYTSPNTDTEFERNATIAVDYLPVGFYWYWKPSLSATTQADYFCNLIKNKRWKIRPVIDVEITDGLSTTVMRDRLKEFVNRIKYNLSVDPLIYTRTSMFDPGVATDPLWGTLGLWIARYSTTLTHPWGDGYLNPRDWEIFDFWQFSADGNGQGSTFGAESSAIDLDYFNGTIDKFYAYIGTTFEGTMTTLIENKQNGILAIDGGGIVSAIVPANEVWTINLVNFQMDKGATSAKIIVENSDGSKLAVLQEISSPAASRLYVVKDIGLYLSPGNKLIAKVVGNTVDAVAQLSYAGTKTIVT